MFALSSILYTWEFLFWFRFFQKFECHFLLTHTHRLSLSLLNLIHNLGGFFFFCRKMFLSSFLLYFYLLYFVFHTFATISNFNSSSFAQRKRKKTKTNQRRNIMRKKPIPQSSILNIRNILYNLPYNLNLNLKVKFRWWLQSQISIRLLSSLSLPTFYKYKLIWYLYWMLIEK